MRSTPNGVGGPSPNCEEPDLGGNGSTEQSKPRWSATSELNETYRKRGRWKISVCRLVKECSQEGDIVVWG